MQTSSVLPLPVQGPGDADDHLDDRAIDALSGAVIGLLHTWRSLNRRSGENARSGLSAMEMASLIGEGEHRLSELAELRNVDQSVISRQIGDLSDRGLVCRRPDPADRRASLVRLTPSGHELLGRVGELRRDWLRGALSRVPGTDVQATARIVGALAAEIAERAAGPTPDPVRAGRSTTHSTTPSTEEAPV
jgi:DNA-binding MarR family transcriptional regulator